MKKIKNNLFIFTLDCRGEKPGLSYTELSDTIAINKGVAYYQKDHFKMKLSFFKDFLFINDIVNPDAILAARVIIEGPYLKLSSN